MSSHPSTARKPVPWGYLVWTLPLAYVFWSPYQQSAGWFEWTVTAATLITVLALFLAGLTFDERPQFVACVCAVLLVIASGFLAYRPSGGLYFPVAAAFVAPAVGGRAGPAMVLVSAIAVLFGAEWGFLYLRTEGPILPLLVAAQIFVSGIGSVHAVRQARELKRRDKTSERERIAKDLHDVLGHSLSSLALKAELARRVFSADPQRALAEIGDVERIARQGLEEMRGAIHGYCAGDIYAELERAEALLKAARFTVESRYDELEMPPAKERVLALIVREAVTNVLRHSQARACRLALLRADGAYRLEIADDGRGGPHREGIGMSSIRTRAEALGGTAVWSSAFGTQLSVSLPISAGEHA
jgi:two-component system, NarL family, sensor histidine kinase DesK